MPVGEAANTDFVIHQKLPDCMRPLPILPADLAAELSEKALVTQYANSEGPDNALQVNITNVATSTLATSLCAPEEGDDDSANPGIQEYNRFQQGQREFGLFGTWGNRGIQYRTVRQCGHHPSGGASSAAAGIPTSQIIMNRPAEQRFTTVVDLGGTLECPRGSGKVLEGALD